MASTSIIVFLIILVVLDFYVQLFVVRRCSVENHHGSWCRFER